MGGWALCLSAGDPVAIDISVGARNGVDAVGLILQWCDAMPPLRPLVLLLKAMTSYYEFLNCVYFKGVSSFCLVIMVGRKGGV